MKRPSPSRSTSKPFGLLAWLEETRVVLPLKGVECRFSVHGAVASVELDQIFHQENARPLDCVYSFPLPAGAAVYRCEITMNERTIRAKVQERGKARRIFRKQKEAGRRAALIETERENLFTVSLGNVQPEDLVVVRLAWFQVLDRAGSELRLSVPTCPGIRYIPGEPLLRRSSGRGTVPDTDQVPDASRISPPRIDALHPDAAYFHLEGTLPLFEAAAGSVSSPSHPVLIHTDAELLTVALGSRGALPDRDFVLAWREPQTDVLASRGWSWREGGEAYALVQLRAPKHAAKAKAGAQDFYFLVDRSGSMQGPKWRRTCEAVQAFVRLLAPGDRVWITLFETSFVDFAEKPLPAREVLADPGLRAMVQLGTGGGTELLPAAEHVLEKIAAHSGGRRSTVIIVTDGQVGNEQEINRAFAAAPHVIVHTFGIDVAVNDAFLKQLARQQRGDCWLRTPDDDIAGTISALGERLQRPVLTDLQLRGAWQTAAPALPDVHAREVITFPLRGTPAATVKVRALGAQGAEETLEIDVTARGSEAIKLLWVQQRIAGLIATDEQREAIALAVRHNLLCEGAAFVAWDEAEKVAVAMDELVQPVQAPHATLSMLAAGCSPTMICAAPLPSARGRVNLDSWLNDDDSSFGDFIAEPAAPIAELVREPLRNAGFSAAEIQELIAWCDEIAAESGERRAALLRAADLIEHVRVAGDLAPRLEKMIHQRVMLCRGDLGDWIDTLTPRCHMLIDLRHQLLDRGAPEAAVQALMETAVEDKGINLAPLEKVRSLANLDRIPFSAGARERHWQNVFAAACVKEKPRSSLK